MEQLGRGPQAQSSIILRIPHWIIDGLPGWLVLPGFRSRWSARWHISSLPLEGPEHSNTRIVDVTVDPCLTLEKTLTFPLAMQKKLQEAVSLHLRQSLPGGAKDVLWTHCIQSKNREVLNVKVMILKSSLFTEIKHMLSERNQVLRSISVAGSQTFPSFWDNRRSTDRLRRMWLLLTLALWLVGLCSITYIEAQHVADLEERFRSVQQHKNELADRIVTVRQENVSREEALLLLRDDLQKFGTQRSRLPLLVDLTDSLDDNTWISELRFEHDRLQISGFAKSEISDVIDRIGSHQWVDQVELTGPVRFDSMSRSNRFDVSVSLLPVAEN